MSITLQTLEFQDFSGGITDNISSTDYTRFDELDNVYINDNKKPQSRPGWRMFSASNTSALTGTRVHTLVNYKDDTELLIFAGTYCYVGSTWLNILGGSTTLFSWSTSAVSHAQWKGHVLVTPDSHRAYPIKLYKNESDAWVARTCGMPEVPEEENYTSADVITTAISLANDIRTNMLAHFANNTDQGVLNWSTTGGQTTVHRTDDLVATGLVAAAATNEATLYTLVASLLVAFNSHQKDSEKYSATYHWPANQAANGFAIIDIPLTKDPYLSSRELVTTTAPTTLAELCAALDDVRLKFLKHVLLLYPHGRLSDNIYTLDAEMGDVVRDGPYIARNLQPIYDLANELKYQKNLHLTSGRHGGALTDFGGGVTSSTAASNATTLATLATLLEELKKDTFDHLLDRDGLTHQTAEENSEAVEAAQPPMTEYTNVLLTDTIDEYQQSPEGDWAAQLQWLTELVRVWNLHVEAQDYHSSSTNAGELEKVLAPIPVYTNYLYGFCYRHTYTVGSVEHVDRGPVLTKRMTNVLEIGGEFSALIQGLPSFVNSADPAQIYGGTMVLEVYRSVANGTTLYKVGDVTAGSTFTDTTSDADLIANETIYTTGGVLDNDPPPLCKYLHVVNDICYYANIIEDGETKAYRIRQSVQGDVDSAPLDLFVDLENECTGISSAKSRPVAFTKGATYRLDGIMDELGGGSISAERISDTVGCISHYGIVQIDQGLLFPAIDGFYFTDGYQVMKLSGQFNTTYALAVNSTTKQSRIKGTYDKVNERVYWAVALANGATEADTLFVLDLNFGIKPEACFTTWSDFNPCAVAYYNSQLVTGDPNGYVLKFDASYLSDLVLDTGTSSALWAQTHITYDIKSVSTNFGTDQATKWVPSMYLKFLSDTYQTIRPSGYNDRGDGHNLALVRWRGTANTQVTEEERHFPAGYLRCVEKQIRITNGTTILYNSDESGTATVNGTANTATLAGSWPSEALIKGMPIKFGSQSYATSYTITAVSGSVLTFSDAGNTAPTATEEWTITGYPRNEKLHLLSMGIRYGAMSNDKQGYHVAETGANT